MKQRSITPAAPHFIRIDRAATKLAFALLVGLAGMPASAQDMPKFDIFEYKIEGNSLLNDLQIERAVMPFLGEGKTLLEVESARAGLERAYHDAGYLTVVVSIPEQNVDSGAVALAGGRGAGGAPARQGFRIPQPERHQVARAGTGRRQGAAFPDDAESACRRQPFCRHQGHADPACRQGARHRGSPAGSGRPVAGARQRRAEQSPVAEYHAGAAAGIGALRQSLAAAGTASA